MRSTGLVIVFVILAVIFFVLAALYWTGAVSFLAKPGFAHHKHAIIAAVLGVCCLIAANFARPVPARY